MAEGASGSSSSGGDAGVKSRGPSAEALEAVQKKKN